MRTLVDARMQTGVGALVYRRRIGAAFHRWQARRPASSASPPPVRPATDATRVAPDQVTPAGR